jgi:hypothetical protein
LLQKIANHLSRSFVPACGIAFAVASAEQSKQDRSKINLSFKYIFGGNPIATSRLYHVTPSGFWVLGCRFFL